MNFFFVSIQLFTIIFHGDVIANQVTLRNTKALITIKSTLISCYVGVWLSGVHCCYTFQSTPLSRLVCVWLGIGMVSAA